MGRKGYSSTTIKSEIYQRAKKLSEKRGVTVSRFIEQAIMDQVEGLEDFKDVNAIEAEMLHLKVRMEQIQKRAIERVKRLLEERLKMEEKLRHYAEHLEELVEGRTKELRESQEKLLRAERLAAIGELAAMVGHDLRNPLQSITNAAYVLRTFYESLPAEVKKGKVSEDAQKMLQIIQGEVAYANQVVSELQDFAKIQGPDLQDINLNSVIHDALSEVEIPDNIEVITRLDETLTRFRADPNQIRRVCSNLISNAVDAMPEGGKLTITSSRKGDFVEVKVQDTGVGISKQNMEKLFTPLFTTKARGLGLGLLICKNLVEGHGGSIEVESEVGKGSTFTIRLPIQLREETITT
ncbi:MAG: sensor histidine kinase [Candidatus Bathyarchaeia archaeon]